MKSDETMGRLGEALRELMRERPFDSISVIDIAGRAGVSRKTFYYHFSDKYALLNWVCYSECLRVRDQIFAGGLWDALLAIAKMMESDRRFFLEAMSDMGQNSFGRYFSDMFYELLHDVLADGLRARNPREDGVAILLEGIVEAARRAIVLWLSRPEEPSAEEFVRFLRDGLEALCAMVCYDRALRSGSSLCDYCIETLSESWRPSPDAGAIDPMPPDHDASGAKRRRPGAQFDPTGRL